MKKAEKKKLDFKFHATVKKVEGDKRVIEGFVSTSDLDRVRDIVKPEAFREALTNYLKSPVLFYNHRTWELPIGKVTTAEIKKKGFFVRAEVIESEHPDLATANAVWELVEAGVLKAFSFGFHILESMIDPEAKIRVIKRLELLEVSIVGIPANPNATFSIAKGIETGDDIKEFYTPEALAAYCKTFDDKFMPTKSAVTPEPDKKPDAVVVEKPTPQKRSVADRNTVKILKKLNHIVSSLANLEKLNKRKTKKSTKVETHGGDADASQEGKDLLGQIKELQESIKKLL